MKSFSIAATSVCLLTTLLLNGCSDQQAPEKDLPTSTKSIERNLVTQNAPTIPFEEVSKKLGIDFYYENGAEGEKWTPETMLGGIAFFDYDNDGDADLLAVSGSSWQQYETNVGPGTLTLYRNNYGTSFTNVTKAVGLDFNGYGFGFAIGDYDNDGWQDLYITALGKNRLFKNIHGSKFIDVTQELNVQGRGNGYSVGAAFFDADNDGDLDLFVANYISWSKEIDSRSNELVLGLDKAYTGPSGYEGSHPYFFRNYGSEGFREESEQAGLRVKSGTKAIGKPLGILPVDLNGDQLLDLVIANDLLRNFAFINDGKGGFIEQGEKIGIAYNNLGKSTAAMGIDVAWLTDDLTLTIAMGNYSGEMTSIYTLDPKHFVFTDDAPISGIGPKSRKALTFGTFFVDLDLDGRMDFVQANGHVEPEIALTQQSQSYKQSTQLFWNCGSTCPRPFMLLPATSVGDLHMPLVGRGVAAADFDNDGDIDLAISEIAGKLRLYKNNQQTSNNWLKIALRQPNKNIYAIGSVVDIKNGEQLQRQLLMPTRSYLSQSETILTFGLGKNPQADSINITWPDGKQQVLHDVSANQILTITKSE